MESIYIRLSEFKANDFKTSLSYRDLINNTFDYKGIILYQFKKNERVVSVHSYLMSNNEVEKLFTLFFDTSKEEDIMAECNHSFVKRKWDDSRKEFTYIYMNVKNNAFPNEIGTNSVHYFEYLMRRI
jgi:hypothetical protein